MLKRVQQNPLSCRIFTLWILCYSHLGTKQLIYISVLQLISYKRFLECTLIQWRISIYRIYPKCTASRGNLFMKSPLSKLRRSVEISAVWYTNPTGIATMSSTFAERVHEENLFFWKKLNLKFCLIFGIWIRIFVWGLTLREDNVYT